MHRAGWPSGACDGGMMKRFLALCGVAVLVGAAGVNAWAVEPDTSKPAAASQPHFKTGPKGGTYQSLVLALAWSPTYCASPSGRADREECAGTHKYGFIAHGLWPQFSRGSGASHGCTGEVTGLTDKSVEKVTGIIPSHKLMAHEWEKHGTCFGTDAATYFGKTREAWDKLVIPPMFKSAPKDMAVTADQVRQAFVAANPGLPAQAVTVACRKIRPKAAAKDARDAKTEAPQYFSEVHVCMDNALNFQACGSAVKDRCKGEGVVPAIK